MAKRLITQADVVKEGELVLDALTIHAADLGDLSPFREKLEGYLEQFRELLAQQKTAAAAKQEISRQIDQVQQTCMTLVAVVRKLVLAHYGTRSEKVVAFGLQPFRGRRRTAEPPATPPPTVE